MVTPSDISGFLGTNWWSGFSVFGSWLTTIFISVIILLAFFAVFILMQYRVKVYYFSIRGDTEKEGTALGPPKKDRGRRVKVKGVEQFRLLFARKTIRDIPYKLEYPDGVFLLRKNRDEFEPIPRPVLDNPSVKVTVLDSGLQLWAQLRGQEIRKRFTDIDLQKKQMFIFAGVIFGCLIFAGIVIWMSYATSNATLGKIDAVSSALSGLSDKIGLGGPG